MNLNNQDSYDKEKIIDMLIMAKVIYERIEKDNLHYLNELINLQDYLERYDLKDDFMLEIFEKKYDMLLEFYYICVCNHLNIKTNVNGIGEKIIKPVTNISKSTTIKYQNINELHNDKVFNLSNNINIQSTKVIATFDNFSIDKIFKNDKLISYKIKIGKLEYEFKCSSEIKYLYKNMMKDNYHNYIDKQVNKFGEIQRMIQTNINFIKRYINKFNY